MRQQNILFTAVVVEGEGKKCYGVRREGNGTLSEITINYEVPTE